MRTRMRASESSLAEQLVRSGHKRQGCTTLTTLGQAENGSAHTHMHMHIHVHVHVHVHIHVHVHKHIQLHVQLHIHIHIHLHMYSGRE